MLALYSIVFLCWVSVSHSAPLSCEDLNRPPDTVDFHYLKGSWVLVLASLSNPAHLVSLKERDSSSISFANHSDTSELSFTRVFNLHGSCQYMQTNITLEGSSFSFPQYNYTVKILQTSCPDCAVMRFDKHDKAERLYLFSRRRQVEPKELEEFSAQAECLGFSAPAEMDSTKELCPEKITTDSIAPPTQR